MWRDGVRHRRGRPADPGLTIAFSSSWRRLPFGSLRRFAFGSLMAGWQHGELELLHLMNMLLWTEQLA